MLIHAQEYAKEIKAVNNDELSYMMNTIDQEELEARARVDYESARSQEIMVSQCVVYDEYGEPVDLNFNPPVRAMVRSSDRADLERWMDGQWLDPVYAIDILDGFDQLPENRRNNAAIIHGTSYSIDGQVTDHASSWVLYYAYEAALLHDEERIRKEKGRDKCDEALLGL